MKNRLMKTILFVVVLAMVCSLVGCGGQKSKEIELTMDNYDDYLEIYVTKKGESYDADFGYSYSVISIEVTANPHYKYNNVELQFEGSVVGWNEGFNNIISKNTYFGVKLNLAGGVAKYTGDSNRIYMGGFHNLTRKKPSENTFCELLSISGTIEEYD